MAVAFSTAAPFNGTPYYSDSWRSFMSGVAVPGVLRGVAEELLPFGDSSGMQVKVKTGEIWAQGFWGKIATQTTVPVPTSHATLARRDRLVWRVTFDAGGGSAGTGGKVELDVLQGTTTGGVTDPLLVQPPDITRNSAIYEGSLAVISVPPAAAGVAANQVYDARSYGGAFMPPLRDDAAVYGDKVSTCRRQEANGTGANLGTNQQMQVFLTSSPRDITVTKIRVHTLSLGLTPADTLKAAVYLGYMPFELSLFDQVTFTTLPANTVSQQNLSAPLTIKAGQLVALSTLKLGTASAANPVLSVTLGVGTGDFLNQGSTPPPTGDGFWSTINKTGVASFPSRVNGHDGTWTKGNAYVWIALS